MNLKVYLGYIWVNYNNSLNWNKTILGYFPLLTSIPVRSQWGRCNLPRYIYGILDSSGICVWSEISPRGLAASGQVSNLHSQPLPEAGRLEWSGKIWQETLVLLWNLEVLWENRCKFGFNQFFRDNMGESSVRLQDILFPPLELGSKLVPSWWLTRWNI